MPQGSLSAVQASRTSRYKILIEKNVFLLRLHLGGHFAFQAEGEVFCDDEALLMSPDTHAEADSRDMSILLVALHESTVARAVGTESCPNVGLRSLRKHGGRHLRAMALAAAHEAERIPEDFRPSFLRHFQNTFACALGSVVMQFAPHFRRPEPMIGRRKISDLCEWARLDHGDPVTAGDLAARCGLGIRALQKNFLRHFDVTPAAFLRNLRLEKARALIVAGSLSVTHAALEAGFVHLGHFSAAYERKYRELPSATMGRCRAS